MLCRHECSLAQHVARDGAFGQLQDGDGGMGDGLTKRGGRGCHVTMSVGTIINHRKNAYHMFQHELVHVMLIYWMQGRDRAYPLRIHEGIASFVGGNGTDFVRMYFLMYRSQYGGRPAQNLKVHAQRFLQARLSAGLRRGISRFPLHVGNVGTRGGGHQFIRHITIEGMAWDAAIIKVSRMTLEDFNSAAFNFAYQAILDLHEQVKKRRRKRSQKSRRPSLSRRKTLIPSDGGFFFVGIYCRAQSLRPQSSETVAGTTTLQLPAFYRNSPF